MTTCSAQADVATPAVPSGNSYVVPGNGTITSWTHNAAAGMGQKMTMKIFRNVSGLNWMVVGHDGPRDLIGSDPSNTFPASIQVKTGDVLGLNSANAVMANNACRFSLPGSAEILRPGDLADGQSDLFVTDSIGAANVTAVFVPTNTFTLGAIERNKNRGTATLTVNVPNAGQVLLAGKGVTAANTGAQAAAAATAPGDVKLLIKASGKKKRRQLNRTGKVKVSPTVTFIPAGGDPSTQSLTVRLRKEFRATRR